MGHAHAPLDIRTILQRVCREDIPVSLQNGKVSAQAELREESVDGLGFELPSKELESLGLKAGDPVQITFEERGRRYQGVGEVLTLALADPGTLSMPHPRALTCLNPEAFLDVVPERWMRGTYTTLSMDLLDGRVAGLSEAGLEMEWVKGRREDFRLGVPLAFSVELGPDLRPELKGTPAYFTDTRVGLRVQEGKDALHLERYRAWVRDRAHESHERDRLTFCREGFLSQRSSLEAKKQVARQLELLVDRTPLILLVAEDAALAGHFASSLGRKFGFGYFDYLTGALQPQLVRAGTPDLWGGFRLILVHQRLRIASGYELIRQVVQKEACPLPVLLMGSEEDLDLKRNRAIAAGAVDYLSVEPFHVLSIMRCLEETLRMCG